MKKVSHVINLVILKAKLKCIKKYQKSPVLFVKFKLDENTDMGPLINEEAAKRVD
ncbi:hypothetical protein [Neobacillus endophyticus]|uniref:hypothetical protein n=1 Tax=Neobacillus endophyticus TaxID=2738405 RepID=UPI001C260B0A|nr:hypothetical protein [Neobacillus endophyticus]